MKFSNIAPGVTALLLLCAFLPAQPFTPDGLNNGFFGVSGQTIPPTGTGGGAPSASNTVTFDIVSNLPGTITNDLSIGTGLGVTIDLAHTFVADLVITLSHCGVSVVLSDATGWNAGAGSAQISHDFGGAYTFRDDAATALDDANSTSGVIDPGEYIPDNSLDPFRGLPAGGVWTVTIYDQFSIDTGTLNTVGSFLHRQGALVVETGLSVTIPPSGSGGGTSPCQNPNNVVTRNWIVTDNGRVGQIGLDLVMNHTYAGDLIIKLAHNGVERTVFNGNASGLFGADFGGFYIMREGGGTLAGANLTSGVIDSGFYGFDDDMSPFHGLDMSGLWTMTICDDAGGDTGMLTGTALYVARAGLTTVVDQPSGDLRFNTKNGSRPGNRYFKPLTFTQGAFPYGWFFGVDYNLDTLITWFNLQPVFPTIWGSFDACVEDPFTFAGPFPAGLQLYYVALEFSPTFGPVIQRSAPQTYTTQ